MFPTRKQWRAWSLPSKLTLVGTVAGIIGLLLSIVFFLIPYLTTQDETEQRLDGLLSAAIENTRSLIRQTEQLYELAELREEFGAQIESPSIPGSSQLKDPGILEQINTDGELFQRLSQPMQTRLPTFIYSRNVFIATLNPDKPDLDQLGTIWLLLIELETQEQCLELEIKYQLGELGEKDHATLFFQVLNQQVNKILARQPK